MARMYSRKKGRAGSTKPSKKVIPSWVTYKPKEIEMLIGRLAKEGKSASEIGLSLRDTYGIPDVKTMTKKKITHFLKEKDLLKEIPEDLLALIKKAKAVRKHLEENKHDQTAKRGLTLTESKLKRLARYYKKTGKMSEDWKYDPDKLQLMV